MPFFDPARDLARNRHVLGCLRRIVRLVVEYDGRRAEHQQERIGRRRYPFFTRYSNPLRADCTGRIRPL